MTDKTTSRKDLKMNMAAIRDRASAFIKEAVQPKEFYADELKDGYSQIIEISKALKDVRDMAEKNRDKNSDLIDGIDTAGQLLATFSKKYTGLTLKMLKYVG